MIDLQAQSVLDEMATQVKPMAADTNVWLRGYRDELDAVVAMQGPAPAIAVEEERVAAAADARLRFYRPGAADGRCRPTLLFVHGGGFVAGSLEAYDIPLRWIALRSGWQVAAIDYRLAPDRAFPAAPDDCFAALRHLAGHADVDTSRLAVGGDSAGGLLATVTARRARDAGLSLAAQIILYPNTDLREGPHHASRAAFDGIVIRMAELYRSLALYCGAADRADPALSPLLAPDLSGLCRTLLVTNEYDPLRDEAEEYGRRLAQAGVRVEAERMAGMIHSAMQRGERIARGDRLLTRVAAALMELG